MTTDKLKDATRYTRYTGLIISPDEEALKGIIAKHFASVPDMRADLNTFTYSRLTNSDQNTPVYAVLYSSHRERLTPRTARGKAVIESLGAAPWLWQYTDTDCVDEDGVEDMCSLGWWRRDWASHATLPSLEVHVEVTVRVGLVDPEDYIQSK